MVEQALTGCESDSGARIVRGLDRELALSRVGGDLELLQEIAQLFLGDSLRMLTEIRNAVESKDPRALNYSAHTLKGCVSNFGAQRLYDAAFVMEQMGRRSDLSNVETAFKLLEAEMHRLEGDLRELTAEQ